MSKTVFFDIDGTIWDDDMVIPESTMEAVAALKANIVHLYVQDVPEPV